MRKKCGSMVVCVFGIQETLALKSRNSLYPYAWTHTYMFPRSTQKGTHTSYTNPMKEIRASVDSCMGKVATK